MWVMTHSVAGTFSTAALKIYGDDVAARYTPPAATTQRVRRRDSVTRNLKDDE
jgi:hypothetical protein